MYIAVVWGSVDRAHILAYFRREPIGCGFSGAQMLEGYGETWRHQCQHKQYAQDKRCTEQFVNKRHSPSTGYRMTDECALAACITTISIWRRNEQRVRHHRVGHANGLLSIGVLADFMRNVLGAVASETLHSLKHLKRFAVLLAG